MRSGRKYLAVAMLMAGAAVACSGGGGTTSDPGTTTTDVVAGTDTVAPTELAADAALPDPGVAEDALPDPGLAGDEGVPPADPGEDSAVPDAGLPDEDACTPDCSIPGGGTKACGDDGCGGSCGSCEGVAVCLPDFTCPVCDTTKADDACDGVDVDCDGSTDEDYAETATTCGKGACAATGKRTCQDGKEVDTCAPGAPLGKDDQCDGVDDDCDGVADQDHVCANAGEVCIDKVCQVDARIWTDLDTGYVWQATPAADYLKWPDAKTYCSENKAALPGTGWTMPSLAQLRTLVRACDNTAANGPCGYPGEGSIDCDGCQGTGPGANGCFWDATLPGECAMRFSWSTDVNASAGDWPFGIDFANAAIGFHAQDYAFGTVRCVRIP